MRIEGFSCHDPKLTEVKRASLSVKSHWDGFFVFEWHHIRVLLPLAIRPDLSVSPQVNSKGVICPWRLFRVGLLNKPNTDARAISLLRFDLEPHSMGLTFWHGLQKSESSSLALCLDKNRRLISRFNLLHIFLDVLAIKVTVRTTFFLSFALFAIALFLLGFTLITTAFFFLSSSWLAFFTLTTCTLWMTNLAITITCTNSTIMQILLLQLLHLLFGHFDAVFQMSDLLSRRLLLFLECWLHVVAGVSGSKFMRNLLQLVLLPCQLFLVLFQQGECLLKLSLEMVPSVFGLRVEIRRSSSCKVNMGHYVRGQSW